MTIYDAFSNRNKSLPDVYQYDKVPQKFSVQLTWVVQGFHKRVAEQLGDSRAIETFQTIRELICREHGLTSLAGKKSGAEDIFNCLLKPPEDVNVTLDLVECCCRTICEIGMYKFEPEPLIHEVNHRFRENAFGFEFNLAAQKLICIKNEFLHPHAIQPALGVLADPRFKTANDEFLDGFTHFRKGQYGDCLTKCCSAFESVMKIICKEMAWPYDEKQTAAPLIQTQLNHNGLDSFFESPLTVIATLRNRLSKSHGAGTQTKDVPEFLASYALNATASAILLLVDAAKLS